MKKITTGMIDSHLKKINVAYNADHDLGPEAPVTWREYELMTACAMLMQKVEELETRLNGVDGWIDRQVQKV